MAIAGGEWRGVLSIALALIAIVRRILLEERFMRQQFGVGYDAYARQVRAFVPGAHLISAPTAPAGCESATHL
jgi:protein-S-isoprenylcysteine O-methyltransferase Ste14